VAIYSFPFIVATGVSGDSDTVTVPDGHVFIVKQLTAFTHPSVFVTRVFFKDADAGGALWFTETPTVERWYASFYGAICFYPGGSFKFSVESAGAEQADVYAGGYDLLIP